MKRINQSRRQFLHTAGQLSVTGVAAPFALNLAGIGAAAAQTAEDYRALVCVFLTGANDHNNTIIPFDAASFNEYTAVRPSIARKMADLVGPSGESLELKTNVPLLGSGNAGRQFALPKELAKLKPIWDSGQLAVLANVGTLVAPVSKAEYLAGKVPLPPKLMSHNDQQGVWQSMSGDGNSRYGWAGRLGDLFAASKNRNTIFTAISSSGSSRWLRGQTVGGYAIGKAGSVRISALAGNLFGSTSAAAAMSTLIKSGGNHAFEQDLADTTARSISADADLRAALASAPQLALPAALTGSPLAQQLRTVARVISQRSSANISAKRQVFFIGMGNYDTHDGQLREQTALHTQLAEALAYFNDTMTAIGAAQLVTTFTASDFGRTLTSNGDGSDHGWGSHHFIMGGAVKGKQFYGTFPIMGLNNNDEIGSGRLIPTTSVDEYAATLARWFGVSSDADMKMVLPNFKNFANPNLGFMG
jgi:uncharacterized protein (DUF1501 family)